MSHNYDALIDAFRKYLRDVGYSRGSCRSLPFCVRSFFAQARPRSLSGVGPEAIERFRAWLEERPREKGPGGLSESYIRHNLYALRLFFTWLQERGDLEDHPMSTLRLPRARHEPREPLTREEMKELFGVCETLKERALLHLFYSCGLRRSEGVALDRRDVRPRRGFLYVRSGKGAKRRAVPLTGRVADELSRYMREEEGLAPQRDPEPFMVGVTGARLRGGGHAGRFKGLLARTTIERTVGLHHLRHSIATHLLEEGLPIEYVRDLLGHRHLEATQIYTKVNGWDWRST